MAFRYAGQFNSYVAKATGQIISYMRDPSKYKVNQYVQRIKSDTPLGRYYLIHPDDTARHVTDPENLWEDGARRPQRTGNRVRHKSAEFQTQRRDYDFQIGWKTLQVADYNVLLANTNSARNERMINLTNRVIEVLETASNWGGNTADAVALDGGAEWDQGTPENPVIKKSLLQVAEYITLVTNGQAADFENADDVGLQLILSPHSARRLASSPEIHSIYKESLHAQAMIGKAAVNPNAIFGLPKMLYGYTVVVENAVRVSERPKVASTSDDALASFSDPLTSPRRFVKSPYSAVIVSRVGGLDGQIGAPSFSTMQVYYFDKEVEVKIFDEAKDELTDGHVTEDCTEKLAAPASGFLVSNILSAA